MTKSKRERLKLLRDDQSALLRSIWSVEVSGESHASEVVADLQLQLRKIEDEIFDLQRELRSQLPSYSIIITFNTVTPLTEEQLQSVGSDAFTQLETITDKYGVEYDNADLVIETGGPDADE